MDLALKTHKHCFDEVYEILLVVHGVLRKKNQASIIRAFLFTLDYNFPSLIGNDETIHHQELKTQT